MIHSPHNLVRACFWHVPSFFVLLLVSVGAAAAQTCMQQPPPEGLIHCWPGDGTAEDVIGGLNGLNPLHGTLENGAGYGPDQDNKSFFSLDGEDAFISTPGEFTFPTDLTIAACVRLRTGWFTESLQMIMATAEQPINSYLQSGLMIHNPVAPDDPDTSFAQLRFFQDYNSMNRGYWYAEYKFIPEQWYHVAITQEGPAIKPKLYVDGVLFDVIADTATRGFPQRVSQPLALGKQGAKDSGYFNGDLDELQIWNEALLVDDIQAIYNADQCGAIADSDQPLVVEHCGWTSSTCSIDKYCITNNSDKVLNVMFRGGGGRVLHPGQETSFHEIHRLSNQLTADVCDYAFTQGRRCNPGVEGYLGNYTAVADNPADFPEECPR